MLWIAEHLYMGVSDMKKFIINIFVFFAIVAIADFAVGKVFHFIQANISGGRTGAEYYACRESNEDIIVMGSSRASHHYVPQVFSDSLHMSCFNAGQDGNGIILQYGRWKMISERYTPKLIIYDIAADFDLYESDNARYVDRLKPYSNDDIVRDYISSIFPIEKLKLLSQMYCFNYKFLEVLSDIRLGRSVRENGFIPMSGTLRDEMVAKETDYLNGRDDDVKQHYLRQLVREVRDNGGDVVFVISPYWKTVCYDFSSLRTIAKELDVKVYDYSDCQISDEQSLFKDSHHLNEEGAITFSGLLANRMKRDIDALVEP